MLDEVRVRPPESIAHYTTNNAGSENYYAPILHKKIYWDNIEHGTWHLHGNIPVLKDSKRPLDGTTVRLVTAVKLSLASGVL